MKVLANNQVVETVRYNGTGALNGVLANSAVVDNGDGTVGIVITGHGLTAGSYIIIAGTTNYNGVHKIESVADANTVNITATYVAETPAGTETYALYFDFPNNLKTVVRGYRPLQTRLKLSDTGADENLTQAIDHATDSKYDTGLGTVNLNGVTSGGIDRTLYSDILGPTDGIIYNYTNTNGRTWGLELLFEVIL
jgi:hypothetical protein